MTRDANGAQSREPSGPTTSLEPIRTPSQGSDMSVGLNIPAPLPSLEPAQLQSLTEQAPVESVWLTLAKCRPVSSCGLIPTWSFTANHLEALGLRACSFSSTTNWCQAIPRCIGKPLAELPQFRSGASIALTPAQLQLKGDKYFWGTVFSYKAGSDH